MKKNVCLTAIFVLAGTCSTAWTQPAGTTSGRDILLGDLYDLAYWGSSGGISAYSVGTISCNIGDVAVPWIASTNQHPVIGQTLRETIRISRIGFRFQLRELGNVVVHSEVSGAKGAIGEIS